MKNFLAQILEYTKEKNPIYIRVKILSKMPETKIVDQMEDGTYKIHVAAQPVRGKANEALCKYIERSLRASDVAIISGGRDKIKLIRISI